VQPHPALPRVFLQYDGGKFSSGNNAFFSSPTSAAKASNLTHEQFVLGTAVTF
ncbi:MAG: hypothetical protein HY692_03595, partial [Cyanobacteria bacterium NC_groundwater_1444_Ag_S-0.65um_54_12]|nr:hypothetical protein [Cyanobacteria bacterium NC_groundwater_1444_Ag_S-0.65um_54_12]